MRQGQSHGAGSLMAAVAVLAVSCAILLPVVRADMASTYAMTELLDWETDSQMQMSISASDGDDMLPLSMLFTVIPLTTDLGLNESQLDRGHINLDGRLILADESTYQSISGGDTIPYLSCDQINGSYARANEMLNALMSKNPQPAAILLYSEQGECCGLSGEDLNFQRILTMPDRNTARQISNMTTGPSTDIRASIAGNVTSVDQDQDPQAGGNNSAVAMSILYSITGLITILFLVIIGTGAIRAHRYPERYGPRSGVGGRPRQSRAKGLARAVLETLPIVKFGDNSNNNNPPKPDPDVELENATPTEPRDTVVGRGFNNHNNNSVHHLSTIPESPIDPIPSPEAAGALRDGTESSRTSNGEGESEAVGAGAGTGTGNDEGLGCSICTEDFNVGEDVRVLPCDHKFHPQCVDPWLVNVSGTCPLCRLDLRPEAEREGTAESATSADQSEVPPLDPEATVAASAAAAAAPAAAGDSANANRRRSRLFDLVRLRHAPVEERIEGLRQYRTQQQVAAQQATSSTHTGEEESHRARRAKLSDRLRDKFHIRTRTAQQPQPQQE